VSTSEPRPALFCSVDLAARIEQAEARMVSDFAEAARRRGGAGGPPPVVVPIAGGAAAWAAAGSPTNKVAGLGFAGVPTEHELHAVESAFDARDTPVQIELANLADAGIAPLLTGRGYRLIGFENVLGIRLSTGGAVPDADPDAIAISASVAEEMHSWLAVLADGFAQPDGQGVPSHDDFSRAAVEKALAELASMAGFHRYFARREGEIAGGASLRVSDGIAQLAGAATLPAHRRRGVQSALLAARLAHAASLGCDLAVVTTLPGSKSQQNAQRRGFDLLYTRAILVRRR
jgi:GNAT superfamily N-acetyltransferase